MYWCYSLNIITFHSSNIHSFLTHIGHTFFYLFSVKESYMYHGKIVTIVKEVKDNGKEWMNEVNILLWSSLILKISTLIIQLTRFIVFFSVIGSKPKHFNLFRAKPLLYIKTLCFSLSTSLFSLLVYLLFLIFIFHNISFRTS